MILCVCVRVRVRNKVEPIYKAIKKKIANGKQQPKTTKYRRKDHHTKDH